MQRDFTQEGQAKRVGFRAGPAAPEYLAGLAAMRAQEDTHVFDQAEQRCVGLLEHCHRLARIIQREVLRRAGDDRPVNRGGLGNGKLCVTGARRHVDDQHVQIAPRRFLQELLDRSLHHGAAPDHGRAGLGQESHRDDFHAVCFQRLDARIGFLQTLGIGEAE